MNQEDKIKELENILQEMKEANTQSAVTVEEVTTRKKPLKLWRVGKLFFALWRRPIIVILTLLIVFVVAVPSIAFYLLKQGSTFSEQKGVYLEQVQNISELATAEAYTKVLIERQDNQLFGQDIGINVPGTKRQVLVVIPGSVKAGVDLSTLSEEDLVIDEDNKKVKLRIPKAQFLGGAEIYFDQVEVYSYEGLFRGKADIEEAYELAEEAKQLILTETAGQGVLKTAQQNAENTLREMFTFMGYTVTIEVKE